MQIRHRKTLLPPADETTNSVTASAWTANGEKLAVARRDRTVLLFNSQGELKEKFPTKPSSADSDSDYYITDIVFSGDSIKCAVAQSDGGIFVYKIGLSWGEKKVICNKFIHQGVGISCMAWPDNSSIIYGTTDGKVRIGNVKSNKSSVVSELNSTAALAIAVNRSGTLVAVGHADNGIESLSFNSDDSTLQQQVSSTNVHIKPLIIIRAEYCNTRAHRMLWNSLSKTRYLQLVMI
jgi:intraflagellar transport protein 172